jgi:hypothetical protein
MILSGSKEEMGDDDKHLESPLKYRSTEKAVKKSPSNVDFRISE